MKKPRTLKSALRGSLRNSGQAGCGTHRAHPSDPSQSQGKQGGAPAEIAEIQGGQREAPKSCVNSAAVRIQRPWEENICKLQSYLL